MRPRRSISLALVLAGLMPCAQARAELNPPPPWRVRDTSAPPSMPRRLPFKLTFSRTADLVFDETQSPGFRALADRVAAFERELDEKLQNIDAQLRGTTGEPEIALWHQRLAVVVDFRDRQDLIAGEFRGTWRGTYTFRMDSPGFVRATLTGPMTLNAQLSTTGFARQATRVRLDGARLDLSLDLGAEIPGVAGGLSGGGTWSGELTGPLWAYEVKGPLKKTRSDVGLDLLLTVPGLGVVVTGKAGTDARGTWANVSFWGPLMYGEGHVAPSGRSHASASVWDPFCDCFVTRERSDKHTPRDEEPDRLVVTTAPWQMGMRDLQKELDASFQGWVSAIDRESRRTYAAAATPAAQAEVAEVVLDRLFAAEQEGNVMQVSQSTFRALRLHHDENSLFDEWFEFWLDPTDLEYVQRAAAASTRTAKLGHLEDRLVFLANARELGEKLAVSFKAMQALGLEDAIGDAGSRFVECLEQMLFQHDGAYQDARRRCAGERACEREAARRALLDLANVADWALQVCAQSILDKIERARAELLAALDLPEGSR